MTNVDRILIGMCFSGLVVRDWNIAISVGSGVLVGVGLAGIIKELRRYWAEVSA